MAVQGGAREERPWSDLPGDLLAAVYLRSASAYDRARFAAVCSPWRAVAAWHPRLPALPLLLPSTGHDREAHAYSPEDGRALRVPLPNGFPWGKRVVGSYEGGWIAALSASDELLVVNLFSGVRAVLISDCSFIRRIVVFSKDPSSGDCIIAAMASGCRVGLHWVDNTDRGWTMSGYLTSRYGDLLDIAFCNGELYGVSFGALNVFDISVNKEGALVATSVFRVNVAMWRLRNDGVPSVIKHIFQLHDKLAMAMEVGPRSDCKDGHFFRVFELADAEDDPTTSCSYAWEEVETLGDHALFLGPGCCKAVHIPTAGLMAGQRGGVERNHIYYSKQHIYMCNKVECFEGLDMGSCTVHCWRRERNNHLENTESWRYHLRKEQASANGFHDCVWLWPPDL